MNNISAKAVAFGEALKPSFKTYAKNILSNAKVMEEELKGYGFKICFGKTQNHLLLIDTVKSKNLTGNQVETVLDEIGITLNKNMIPDDTRSPFLQLLFQKSELHLVRLGYLVVFPFRNLFRLVQQLPICRPPSSVQELLQDLE